MSLYNVALFAHIVGALLVYVALTVEGVSYRFGFDAAQMNRVVGPISALLILVPGLYMVKDQWGWTGWIVVGIVTYVLIAAAGAFTGILKMRGSMSRRAALVSWLLRIGLATGVVFDMVVKPDLVPAVLAVVFGLALGAVAGLAAPMRAVSA